MQTLPTPPPGGWTLVAFPKDAPTRAELINGVKRTHIGRLKTQIPFPIDIPLEAPKP